MSNYDDFFAQDFAGRCAELLNALAEPAQAIHREVTFLLTMAAAGLVVPHERLDGGSRQPTLDRKRYKTASDQLLASSRRPFSLSLNPEDWSGGFLASGVGKPDEWPELTFSPLPPEITVGALVLGLRHAIAHGNIFTWPSSPAQIHRIVFVCGYPNSVNHPLRYTATTPEGLRAFLDHWFSLIRRLQAPADVVAATLSRLEAA